MTLYQELRDITIQPNPFEIIWPTMPYDPPEEVLINETMEESPVVSDGI